MATHDDIESNSPSRLAVIEAATGKVLLRHPLGQPLSDIAFSPDGHWVAALQSGFSGTLFLAEPTTGMVRAVRLPEAGIWSYTFAADSRALWVATRPPVPGRRYPGGDAHTRLPGHRIAGASRRRRLHGDADGRLLWVSADGRLEQETALAALTACADYPAAIDALREAKLVDSSSVNPLPVGVPIPLGFEYTNGYGDGVLAVPRGDGICPLEFAIRFPAKGRYRLTVELANAKDKPEQIHPVQTSMDNGSWQRFTPKPDAKWTQTLEDQRRRRHARLPHVRRAALGTRRVECRGAV